MKVGDRLSVWDTFVDGEVADHRWKCNLARIIFDGLIGEVPANARRAQGMFTVRLRRKSEEVQFRFPMRKDPVQGWEPVDGGKAVHDAAMRALMLQQEPLAEDGKAHRARMVEMRAQKERHRKSDGHLGHDERLRAAQRFADAVRNRWKGMYFTRKGMLRDISDFAKDEGVTLPPGTLRDWEKKGLLRLKLEPDE